MKAMEAGVKKEGGRARGASSEERRERSKGRSQEREGAAGVPLFTPSLPHSLSSTSGEKKSALNVTTTPHAFSLALMVPLLHTLSPHISPVVGEKLA